MYIILDSVLNKKIWLCSILCLFTNVFAYRQVVVAVPVADLVSQPLGLDCHSQAQVRAHYAQVPASWQQSSKECLRVHQAIFNEVLDVVSETPFELEVAIKNSYYGPGDLQTLWALKENFVFCDQAQLQAVPAPINYQHGYIAATSQIVTLKSPFYDFVTSKLYSAGTRFCCLEIESLHAKILINNFETGKICATYIPLFFCHILYPDMTINTKKVDFVDILQSWARLVQKNQKYAVPFVWGGASFRAKASLINCKNIINRPKSNHELAYRGFDASGLILRAAQIAGLPYFYKNSTTALANLHEVSSARLPKVGDILGAAGKGFIVVVSDVENNQFIRAAGVSAGYGYVVENSLNELFLGINTYRELVDCINAGESLTLIGVNGEHRGKLDNLKIYEIR